MVRVHKKKEITTKSKNIAQLFYLGTFLMTSRYHIIKKYERSLQKAFNTNTKLRLKAIGKRSL